MLYFCRNIEMQKVIKPESLPERVNRFAICPGHWPEGGKWFILLFVFLLHSGHVANGQAAWNCDCLHRKSISVSNPGSTLTDYQLRIDVDYESSMNADFSDLFFTTDDGETEINYWIETFQPSASATVWVKVPSIPSGNTTIYMYYGGCSPTLTAPEDVFVFYDDFSSFSGWNNYGAGSVVQNTSAFSYPVGAKIDNCDPNGGWKLLGTTIDDFRLITREQRPVAASNNSCGLNRYGVENASFDGYNINRSAVSSGTAPFGYERRNNGSGGDSNSTNLSQPIGNWFITELRRCSSTNFNEADLYDDSRNLIGGTSGTITNHNYFNFDRITLRGGHDFYVDFMAVAKYTCNEPTVSVGVEEDIALNADFFSSSTTILVANSVTFTDLSDGNPDDWGWTFSGGIPATSTLQNPTITYNSGGTYNVSLVATNPCGLSDTETKTGYITVIDSPPICSSPVSPATNETDVAVDATLSWDAITGAEGYYIYFGTDAAATNIENGTDLGNVTSYTPGADLSFNTDYYWKIVPYNSIGAATGCSIWTFTTEDFSYCIPGYATGTGEGDYISLVQLGDINNSTFGSPSPFYTYYNSLTTDLTQGDSYTITVGSGTYFYNNDISVWIDFNHNGTFETSEKLGNVRLFRNSTGTINFTVASGANLGTTRMRVREAWNVPGMDPCMDYIYGETEDYNVNITSSCVDATLTLNTGNSTQSQCEQQSITDIVYLVGGDATGASVSGLPAGVTGSYNSGIFTISGTPTGSGTFNYTVTTTGTPGSCSEAIETGTITINPLPAAPTANNKTATYTGSEQTASANVGVGETVDWYTASIGGSTTSAPSGTDVGVYTAWAEARNITTGCVSATRTQVNLTINKKDLQVTAIAPDITYGDEEPVVTAQYSGFAGSDDALVLDNTGFILGTDYTKNDPVGTYNTSILIGTATDNNYNFNPLNNSTFLVKKKELTFTADNQTVTYGTHVGNITQNGSYTITGFISGDNSSVITGLGSISYTTNYTETTNAGTSGVIITPVVSGLSASNYSFKAASGTITILKADQYIVFEYEPFTQQLNEFDTIRGDAISSSGLPVIITLGTGSAATLHGTPGNYYLTDIGITGTVTIYANQAGNANYNPAAQETLFFDVTKSNQNISFPEIDDVSFDNGLTIDLQATASSGLSVDYTVVSGPAAVSGNELIINGAGEVWVQANQPGDASYNEAASVLQSFTVNKGTQTITINVPSGTIDETTPITATSTSGLPVTLTLGAGSAATGLINQGGYYTLTGIAGSGFIYIVGNQPGDANFFPADQVIQTIDLGKTNQTITFPAISNKTYGDPPVTLNATASSGLSVSYTLISGPASLIGNTLTLTGAGTVIVEASQAGNGTYNPAPPVTQQFEIGKATPVITQADIVKTFGDAAFTVTPTSESGGNFSFISGDDDIFTITGNTATITGAGTTILDITQQPTANYFGVVKTVSFTVNKAASTISMTGAISFTYDGTKQGPETSMVTGSAGAVTYSYEGTGSTVYGPSSIKPIDAGTYVATATVAEDENYLGATSLPYAFTILKADAIINITSYSVTYDGLPHISTGNAVGVLGEALSGLDLSATTHTNAGTYNSDTWIFTDLTGNYNDATGTVNNTILPALLTISADDQAKCFDETFSFNGTEFTSSGLVAGESIGTVLLTSSGSAAGTVAGTYAITPSNAVGGTFNPINYSITYIDGEMVVNPLPTLTGASQDAAVCEDNTAIINLEGLLAGSTFTLEYSINSVVQTPVSGLIADGSGNSSFTTPVLSDDNDGDILQITGITITSEIPGCSQTFSQDVVLSVDPLPTLSSAIQATSVCDGTAAIINLGGLLPNSTSTISYTIDGGATVQATGLLADGSGNSNFTTSVLTLLNDGQILQITEIENETTGCVQTFTRDVILEVDPETVGGSATASDSYVCVNNNTTIEVSGYTGEIQWQQSADGVAGWTNVTGGSGETSAIYTTADLTALTYYRAKVTSGACVPQYSTVTSVSVEPLPTLTGAAQLATVCEGSGAGIDLSGLLPNTTFSLSYSINDGATTIISGLLADGSGNSGFTTASLAVSDDGKILQIEEIEIESTGCKQRFTQSVILKVDPVSVGGIATANDPSICENENTTIQLSGYTGTIQWQQSADGSTGWINVTGGLGETTDTYTTPNLTTSNFYRAVVTSGVCSESFSSVAEVTVNPLPATGEIIPD